MNKLEKLIIKYAKQYEGKPIAISGGIDSGLLAALIKPKFAISVELPEGKHNEIKEAKKVATYLKLKHIIVKLDDNKFEEDMKIAVKAIGRPIPHFNIFPLFEMYKTLAEMGEKEIVLGDGPDETMCGYARDLIINYLYEVYEFEAFENYKPLIDKILPPIEKAISAVLGKEVNPLFTITEADKELMRPDMDDMSNGIAKHFGITNLRPYQDNKELDDYMLNLPLKDKIYKTEYGKYALRKIAEKYLPEEIAWQKKKVGGPVYPVNIKQGWEITDGEFGKKSYLEYQRWILSQS
jgi:asparagine synthetase B (glutamine-hydrolysing)